MKIELVTTDSRFDELESDWNYITQKIEASYFSSFQFIRTAWQCYHRSSDRLAIIVVLDGETTVGIAPLFVSRSRIRGIPCRKLNFIGLWQGDRPEILIDGDKTEIWQAIVSYLHQEFTSWDVIDFIEQPARGPAENGWLFLFRAGLYWEKIDDAIDYYVPLEGEFDDYLMRLSANTRSDWRRKTRRFREHVGELDIECVSKPEKMADALNRFFTLERSGWKIDAGIAAGQTEADVAFYENIVRRLSATGEAKFYFLKNSEADIACVVNFYHRNIVYMRHTIYDPAYAKYSPGIVLLGEVIRELFGTDYKEYDLLGMQENDGPQRYKLQWAKGVRETVQWTGYRVKGRLLPWLVIKRLKPLFTGKPS